MYRITLYLIVLLLLSGCVSYKKVYICRSESAYVYHKARKCVSLRRCTHAIRKVTLRKATGAYHRSPCKPCYNL